MYGCWAQPLNAPGTAWSRWISWPWSIAPTSNYQDGLGLNFRQEFHRQAWIYWLERFLAWGFGIYFRRKKFLGFDRWKWSYCWKKAPRWGWRSVFQWLGCFLGGNQTGDTGKGSGLKYFPVAGLNSNWVNDRAGLVAKAKFCLGRTRPS